MDMPQIRNRISFRWQARGDQLESLILANGFINPGHNPFGDGYPFAAQEIQNKVNESIETDQKVIPLLPVLPVLWRLPW